METEKRMAGDYEITQSIQIGDREIVMGINESEPNGLCYLVAYYESNGLLGQYFDAEVGDDYAEITETYGQRINEQARKTLKELNLPRERGIDITPITASDCNVINYESDLNNQIIVIKQEVLRPEYRKSVHQIKFCTGGFGAYPSSRGSAVYCTDLYNGNHTRFERRDVLGTLEPEQLPEWAKHQYSLVKSGKEKEQKNQNSREGRECR